MSCSARVSALEISGDSLLLVDRGNLSRIETGGMRGQERFDGLIDGL